MLKVLGRGTSGNVQKVIWLLEELGLPYEREDYGRQFNNTQTEAYLKLNPNGKVPTLVDGDVAVWESNTILRYLCSKSPGGAALHPADPAARSQVERWMDWQLASLNAPYLGVFREAKKKEEERASSFAADSKELTAQLEILEKGTAGRPWLAGERFSLADICLGPIIDRTLAFPVTLPALPGLKAWREKLVAREAYKRSKG
ncbi:MAG: glutathione S-transferase family protein [Steroidobacteraceae bacterium]|jgi:glutathione S-transferase